MQMELHPYVCLGPVRFGMSPSEVEAVIGAALPPRGIGRKRSPGVTAESRAPGNPGVIYKHKKVQEIELYSNNGSVIYQNIDLFREDIDFVRSFLIKNDDTIFQDESTYVFMSLGIATDIFSKERGDTLNITAFERGLWDDLISMLKPLKK